MMHQELIGKTPEPDPIIEKLFAARKILKEAEVDYPDDTRMWISKEGLESLGMDTSDMFIGPCSECGNAAFRHLVTVQGKYTKWQCTACNHELTEELGE